MEFSKRKNVRNTHVAANILILANVLLVSLLFASTVASINMTCVSGNCVIHKGADLHVCLEEGNNKQFYGVDALQCSRFESAHGLGALESLTREHVVR